MRNSEATKEKILTVSASLFNVQGFKATSLSDITEATGLTKGAIYRHFRDKEALESSTYEFISHLIFEKLGRVVKSRETAPEKLEVLCDFFVSYINDPLIKGGCPILNAGVEADDTMPEMNLRVNQLLNQMQAALENIILKGIKYNQIKEDTDPVRFATIFLANMEGAILMSKIRKTNTDILMVTDHLKQQIKSIQT
ncbi:TetR/AcrR family transcriptional regulator [Pararhodonellum marinum]|uniref:TetR/AcrR family transcriptional regulator n=1 Tax=Pararhodonellum marinum TaxID=2755358 RepID=UPI00188FA77A|nr:TetR/AcrR family transcriptional regulator [Pararhodonellum marinum]